MDTRGWLRVHLKMDPIEAKRAQVSGVLEQIDLRRGLLAGHVMTPQPSCIGPETTVRELVELFYAKQFRHLLVTDGQSRLVGVISDRDVLRCLGPGDRPEPEALARITAGQIMSTDLITIGPETPLARVVVLMIDHGINCLPVLVDGDLVGIITNSDLHVVLQILLESAWRSSPEESVVSAATTPQN